MLWLKKELQISLIEGNLNLMKKAANNSWNVFTIFISNLNAAGLIKLSKNFLFDLNSSRFNWKLLSKLMQNLIKPYLPG